MKILIVAGARPNFMKIAPLINEISKYKDINTLLVHTGQHYDKGMSQLFFQQLNLPKPDICLKVGSASHAVQTAKIMIELEKILQLEKPDIIIVVGDVNSTLAAALTAVKMGIPIAHIESGLRSYDRSMPEEINRILTDAISEYHFTTEKSAQINLLKEGVSKEKIFFVGNVMIDTLLNCLKASAASNILQKLQIKPGSYALLTLHRPSNVDNKNNLAEIMSALREIQKHIKIIYPAHPRTQKNIENFNLSTFFPFLNKSSNNSLFKMIDPLGYLDFIKLVSEAKFVLTDSGGIQEETTVLGVPCITLRKNTERPITVMEGTNVLAGTEKESIINETLRIIKGNEKTGKIPEKWDGQAAKRIVRIILNKNKLKYSEGIFKCF